VDIKQISGSDKSNDTSDKSNDTVDANVKSNSGIVANSDASNTDVQTNTGSVDISDDYNIDSKPNIGRVAASIQSWRAVWGNTGDTTHCSAGEIPIFTGLDMFIVERLVLLH
jgi:hypothetical protein